MAPSSSALAAAAFIHRLAVDRDALMILSTWLMFPNCRALVRTVCSSAWTGTILALLPLPCHTRTVGRSASRASTVSASEILSPALHSTRKGSRARGFELP